ncbi:MAG: hypothetical protein H6723_07600 [Sandaracinus sp.]|nr:hypothetical protein [Sandaracinus sp.]
MRLLLLLLAFCSIPTTHVSAQLEDPELRALHQSIVPYGSSTLEALEGLARYQRGRHRARDRDLARYLHAIVSADLWIVARRNQDAALEADLARAHEVAPSELPGTLTQALAAVRFGSFLPEVDDALAALQNRAARGNVRGDLLYANAVMRALGARAPLPALAALADDPCAPPEAACPDVFRPFDAEGRRAIHAVVTAQRATALIRERAEQGDPLARATVGALELDRALLAMTELAPSVVGFARLGELSPLEGSGPRTSVDVVLHVDSTEIRYAFAPRVAFDAHGARLVGEHGPLLPAFETLAMPAPQRAFPEAIPELVALLRSLAGVRVAFAPSPTLSTMDLWRVVRSADSAGTPLGLAAIDAEGRICVRALEWREESTSPAEVYVRLGGYSVRMSGAAHDLPRVRRDEGLSYDAARLRSLVATAPTLAVRAMHDMPVAPVVDALFVADRTMLVRH